MGKVTKPWGGYEVLMHGPKYWIKVLTVAPGCMLSLQKHQHRHEAWTVVMGEGIAEIHDWPKTLKNGDKRYIMPGDRVDIPCGAKHRLSNPTDKYLIVCEVAIGDDVREDDIIRYADEYGRKVESEDSSS